MIEIRVYASTILAKIPQEVYWGALMVFVVGGIGLMLWKGVRAGRRYVSVLALAEWLFLVLCATVIFRGASAERGFRLIPFSSYWDFGPHGYLLEMVAENLLNVMLFVPVGFLLGCGFREMTWKGVLLFGCGVSVFIELLQLTFKRGLCEIDDVIHNVIGCMMGYVIYRLSFRLLGNV